VSALGLLLRSCVFQYRALFSWATPPRYLVYKVLGPVSQVLFFVQLGIFATGRASAVYYALGNALQLAALNGIYGVVMTLGAERQFGTLPLLLGSPANRLLTFLGRAAVHVLDGVVGVALGLGAAMVVYHIDLRGANLPLFAGCVLLISASTAGLGLFFASFSLVARDVLMLSNIVYTLLLVVCGVNFPVGRLPAWAQVVSYALPLTRGVSAARLAASGATLAQVLPLLLGEAAVGLVYVGLGYAVFRGMELLSRRGGLQDAV